MKKLLILLVLCMVCMVVLVSCNKNKGESEETTPETTIEETTEAPTTEPESTTAETTEAETTEAKTTTEKKPEPEPVKVSPGMGWNSLVIYKASTEGTAIFTSSVGYADWAAEKPTVEIDILDSSLHVKGWVAFFAQTEGTVGYKVGKGDVVYNIHFTDKANDDIQSYIKVSEKFDGALSACEMDFHIPMRDVAVSENGVTVALYAKDVEGNEQVLQEFTVIKKTELKELATDDKWGLDSLLMNDETYFEPETEPETTTEEQTTAAEEGSTEEPKKETALDQLAKVDNTVDVKYNNYCYDLNLKGWTTTTKPVKEIGYYVVGVTDQIIFDPAFLVEAGETAVKEEGKNTAGFDVHVFVGEQTYGLYEIGLVAKLEDDTLVSLYTLDINLKNLSTDGDYVFITSIDKVNGQGPKLEVTEGETTEPKTEAEVDTDESTEENTEETTEAETTVPGDVYAPNFIGVGGTKKGTIDAAANNITNNVGGIITVEGWFGVKGGVNRYVWCIDGVNWNTAVGGTWGEPEGMEGIFEALINGEELPYNNAIFSSYAPIQIQLTEEYVGKTVNIQIGAIPELDQESVIVFCELKNVTVAPFVTETVYYDGENGTQKAPANLGVKYFFRNQSGKCLKIENAENLVVYYNNMDGETGMLEPVDGVIEFNVPDYWLTFELLVENKSDAKVEVTVAFEEIAVERDGMSYQSAFLMEGTEGNISFESLTGWDGMYYAFVAEADGTLNFAAESNVSVRLCTGEWSDEWLFDGSGTVSVVAGETYTFYFSEANFEAGMLTIDWSFTA